jgi:hypothetical protein
MKMIFDAKYYAAFCRSVDGGIWVLHGNQREGVWATRITERDMKGVAQFESVPSYGMTLREFQALHKALANADRFWEACPQLKRDTVFYRCIEINAVPLDLEPHHRTKPARVTKKARSKYVAIIGAACHYRTTTLTVTGDTPIDQELIRQIYDEALFKDWKIEHHQIVFKRNQRGPGNATVQFTFQIGTPISQVRKHLLARFPKGEANAS